MTMYPVVNYGLPNTQKKPKAVILEQTIMLPWTTLAWWAQAPFIHQGQLNWGRFPTVPAGMKITARPL